MSNVYKAYPVSGGKGFLDKLLTLWIYALKAGGMLPACLTKRSTKTTTRSSSCQDLAFYMANFAWPLLHLTALIFVSSITLLKNTRDFIKSGQVEQDRLTVFIITVDFLSFAFPISCFINSLHCGSQVVQLIHELDTIFRQFLNSSDKRAIIGCFWVLTGTGIINLLIAVFVNRVFSEQYALSVYSGLINSLFGLRQSSMALRMTCQFLNAIYRYNLLAVYLWHSLLVVMSYSASRCFVRLTQHVEDTLARTRREPQEEINCIHLKGYLDIHSKLSTLIQNADEIFSKTALIMFLLAAYQVLYRVILLGEFIRDPKGEPPWPSLKVLITNLLRTALQIVVFASLFSQTKKITGIMQAALEDELPGQVRSLLIMHLTSAWFRPAGVSMGGLAVVNKGFAVSFLGSMIGYIFTIWQFTFDKHLRMDTGREIRSLHLPLDDLHSRIISLAA